MQKEEMLVAAKTWIMKRLEVCEATPFALQLGVAEAAGLWDIEQEVFTDSKAAERVTAQAIDELIADGRVWWKNDYLEARA